MIPLLAPLFPGEWAPYGATLTCSLAGGRGFRLADLLDDASATHEILERYMHSLGTLDRRPAVARWALAYFTALLPPVVAAATVLHHVFPITARQITITLDDDGVPRQFHIPDEGVTLPSSSAAIRYTTLLVEHLDPLIARLAAWGNVSRRLLWGNAARRFEDTLEQVETLAGEHAELRKRITQDRQSLLHEPAWLERRNPLFMRVRRVYHGRDSELRLHRQCCLSYLLPGEEYCQPCPLAPHNNPR